LVTPVRRLAQNLFIAAPTVAQHAALGAFEALSELEARIDRYRINRALLLSRLREAGVTRLAPADGAFYLYADVSRFTDDSVGLCKRLLEEVDVAVTPGVDFDPARGHRFIRLSFAGPRDEVSRAAQRLAIWFEANQPVVADERWLIES
jgi:aspartate/methionine/tyrosine aminotransferase